MNCHFVSYIGLRMIWVMCNICFSVYQMHTALYFIGFNSTFTSFLYRIDTVNKFTGFPKIILQNILKSDITLYSILQYNSIYCSLFNYNQYIYEVARNKLQIRNICLWIKLGAANNVSWFVVNVELLAINCHILLVGLAVSCQA